MSTNKQALRTAAENATQGEWCSDDHYGVVADAGLNGNFYVASCSGPEHRANKRFIAAANPATVLALLDELEAADELNKHLELAIRKAEGCSEALRRKAEAAEKRVAELEAREVVLPSPGCTYADHSYPAYTKGQVLNLLAAAGITVKGE